MFQCGSLTKFPSTLDGGDALMPKAWHSENSATRTQFWTHAVNSAGTDASAPVPGDRSIFALVQKLTEAAVDHHRYDTEVSRKDEPGYVVSEFSEGYVEPVVGQYCTTSRKEQSQEIASCGRTEPEMQSDFRDKLMLIGATVSGFRDGDLIAKSTRTRVSDGGVRWATREKKEPERFNKANKRAHAPFVENASVFGSVLVFGSVF
jgi:hypothetical protein